MDHQLTKDGIALILNGNTPSEVQPVLQVVSMRSIGSTANQVNGSERYRLSISDGDYTQQGMLSTQLNELVRNGFIQVGSIVKLVQFVFNTVQNRPIIIITNLDVILDTCDVIGEPKPYPWADGSAPTMGRTSTPSQSTNQPAANIINPQTYGGPAMSGSASNMINPQTYGGPAMSGSATNIINPQTYGGSDMSAPTANIINPQPYGGSAMSAPAANIINPQPYGGSAMSGSAPRSRTDGIPVSGNMVSGRIPANAPLPNLKPVYGKGVPQVPAHSYVNQGPAARHEPAQKIMPIAALNPFQGRWSIKARVTSKSELRKYSNARGEGCVFSFDLLDSQGGEIRVTCFNDVANQFSNEIKQGEVYIISNGMLKAAQKNYNHLPNDHEIVLDKTSTVQSCPDDRSIKRQQFNFRSISEIEGLTSGIVVDTIGVVSSISPSMSINRKDGKVTQKRSLQLMDSSGKSMEVTMWGNFCDEDGKDLETICESGKNPVLALKSVRVTEFNGKCVGTVANSMLFIDPEFPEAQQQRVWFDMEGKSAPVISLSKPIQGNYVRKTISQIQDEKLGTGDRADLISVVATVAFIKQDNYYYNACCLKRDGRQCNKKVIDNGDGAWECSTCNQTMKDIEERYILQLAIQDHTGQTYVTAFQESGEEIMGHPAGYLVKLKKDGEDEKFDEVIRSAQFSRFLFKLRVKVEVYNDEQRVKSTVSGAEKLVDETMRTETKYLLDEISKLGEEVTGSLPIKSENNISAPSVVDYSGMNSNVPRDSGAYTAQTGTHGNQFGSGSRFPSTGTTYTSCTSCGGSGHNSANCPSLMSGPSATPGPNFGASSECYKCHQVGHWANNCPGTGNDPPAYGGALRNNVTNGPNAGGASGECFKCHQFGHWAKDCPVSNVPPSPAYSSSNGGPGRYYTNQRAGF